MDPVTHEPGLPQTLSEQEQVAAISIEVYRDGPSGGAIHIPPMIGGRQGPPPSYEEINDPNAPPPSYNSLFGRVQEVQKSSNGFLDFIKNLLVVLLGTIGCTIMIVVTLVIPVAMIVIGSLYVKACPTEDNIPIYLIVGGIFGLLKQVLALRVRFLRARNPEQSNSNISESLQSLINCFLMGWFITGCFWVYRSFEPDYENQSSKSYCNPTLYSFSFWLLTSTFIIMGLAMLCLCCVSSTALLLSRAE